MVSDGLNEGVVGDTAKLVAHRLIARSFVAPLRWWRGRRPLMPARPSSSQLALRTRVGGPKQVGREALHDAPVVEPSKWTSFLLSNPIPKPPSKPAASFAQLYRSLSKGSG
ncbi:hypothetical protein ACVWW4_001987 [Bradyrhizobium sp. LB7.1]